MQYNDTLINAATLLHVNAESFEDIALQVFRYQHAANPLYRSWCDALSTDPGRVTRLAQVPFLPVGFFKTHRVVTGDDRRPELIFESSGTTGETPSRHYVTDAAIYEQSLLQGFQQYYGPVADYVIVALLPSYLERQNASLVHMASVLMQHSGHTANGFYINEWERLHQVLTTLEQASRKTLLLGVTFALLDFAERCPMQLRHTIVMETGGMKGRRRELTRAEVHEQLMQQLGVAQVHSEYGMTELLSQAYAASGGLFHATSTMRVLIRDLNDPLDVRDHGTGALNIIDLANVNSCSFIATEDIGQLHPDGSFQVLGRMDHSALRGCSLMVV